MTCSTIREYQPGDEVALLENMREADLEEVRASSGPDVARTLARAVEQPGLLWAIEYGDQLQALFGAVTAVEGELGVPWLLGTKALDEHPRILTTETRRYIQRMREHTPKLYNFVDARNTTAIRWLAWAGFDIWSARPHGYLGLPFHPFMMGFTDVQS